MECLVGFISNDILYKTIEFYSATPPTNMNRNTFFYQHIDGILWKNLQSSIQTNLDQIFPVIYMTWKKKCRFITGILIKNDSSLMQMKSE